MAGRQGVEIVAVASFGGHFEQLLELRQAWAHRSSLIVTTRGDAREALAPDERLEIVSDCHNGQWFRSLICSIQLLGLLVLHRPRLLVSTGALPGLIATIIAKFMGCQTIWIDSVANAQTLSTSGRHASRFADVHLSQWPQVAEREGGRYVGSLF